MIIDQYIG